MANNPVHDIIADFVSRGVKVTLITNAASDYVPKYGWALKEHWWGDTAKFSECEFAAYVVNYDDDYSRYAVRHHGCLVANGEIIDGDHFSACIEAAEAELQKLNAPFAAEARA